MNTPDATAIQDLIERALAASSADGCVVIGAESTRTNLRWAANSLTTNGQTSSRTVTVISTFDRAAGTSAGVVTRAVSTPDELDELVRASERAGRAAGPAEDAVPLVADYEHDDDWSGEPARTDVGVFERFAPELGAAFDRWRKADRLLFGYAEHELTSTFLASSTGLRRRFDQPDGVVQLNGKSADYSPAGYAFTGGGTPTRSAYASRHAADFAGVDATALADEVERRLGWAAERVELPAGRYETIMPPSTVADLMIYTYWTASARDAEEGRNVFTGPGGRSRIGESLSQLPLRLYSDPAHPGLECAPFEIATASDGGTQSVFDNGLPSPAADWIRDGRLTDLIRTRSWAARTGAAPRPGVGNLILSGAAGDQSGPSVEQMVANTERGLLLTCLWYIRVVDPQTLLLTGLTRDGVYLVENGAVTGAVNNFRFNESPVGLLGRATEVGRTEPTLSREWSDYFTRTAMPALRIPDFNMSTVSQAS